MRRLVLVKHALPVVSASAASADWVLSAEGVRQCGPLADALATYLPATLSSSAEAKAERTARLVGERLGLAPRVVPGLQEHDRRGTPLVGQDEFEAAVARLFARPAELVYGNESAADALARFATAVDGLFQQTGEADNLIVVAHGTVIALYVASRTGTPAFDLWRRLQCPSFVALTVPDWRVERIVDRIA